MYLTNDKLIFSNTRKEYFAYDLNNESITRIDIQKYCEILFGKYNYRLRNILNSNISITKNRIYSTFYQGSDLSIFDIEGELIEKRAHFFDDLIADSISVNEDKDEIWVASSGFQIVDCIELKTGNLKIRFGIIHEETEEMSFPEDVFVFNDEVYISEMGNKRVSKIDLNKMDKSTHLKVHEPIWKFVKNQLGEFVLLDSGIHRVVDGEFIKIKPD